MTRWHWTVRRPDRVLAFLLPGLLALILVLAVRVEDYRQAFLHVGQSAIEELQQVRDTTLAMLTAIGSSYQAMNEFDASRLFALAGSMRYNSPGVQLVAFATWVEHGEENAFVAEMVEGGYPTYRIRGQGAQELMPGKRGHLPIRFVEPNSPRLLHLLGMDVLRDGDCVSQVRELAAAGLPAVLEAWHPGPVADGLVFYAMPTYRGFFAPLDTHSRLVQLDGLFLFGVDPQVLVSELQRLHPEVALALGPMPAGEAAGDGVRVRPVFEGGGLGLRLTAVQPTLDGLGALHMNRDLRPGELLSATMIFLPVFVGLASLSLLVAFQKRDETRVQLVRKEHEIEEERRRADGAMRSISDAILMLDEHFRIRYANRVAERMLGQDAATLLGRPAKEVLVLLDARTGAPLDALHDWLQQMSEHEKFPDLLLLTPARDRIPVNIRVSRLREIERQGVVVAIRDISHEHELTARLTHQANHDALTGLLNRAAFEVRVRSALARSIEEGVSHALIFIDLDRFKLINDTHGHQAGDRLLKQVAEVLQRVLRGEDCLGRLGGDEFAVLMRTPDLEVASKMAHRLRERLQAIRFLWDDQAMEIHASLGVVPVDATSGSFEELMTNVDLACHEAKEAGRNTVHVLRADDRVIGERKRQIQWLPRLQEALEERRFVLYRQPIWHALDQEGEPAMYELLLRLCDDEGNDLLPGVFLPSAERFDLMRAIDRHVIELAMQAMSDPSVMPRESVCTINLSGQTLTDEHLLDHIQAQAQRHGVDPQRVCFEVTETVAISNLQVAGRLAQQLRERGYRLMLDDFGAGMSSLGYLHQIQVDFIKIDGQFVRRALTDPLSAVSVRMICEIAHVLGVETIAEMIEDQQTVQCMRGFGVDYLQGFHLARPESLSS